MKHFNEDFAYSFTRLCPICHDEFEPSKHNQVYCHDCLDNRRAEIRKRTDAARKKRRYKRSLTHTKNLEEILEDLNEYNERHGTYLSYGKYVSKLENGTLKD